MICHVCGAKIPDGEMFCPRCGAGQQSSETVPKNRAAVYTATASQKPRMRVDVVEPLESFYSARKALVILSGLMVVALMALLVFLNVTSYYRYEAHRGFLSIYPVVVMVQTGFAFFVVIWQFVLLIELKSFEERFGKVVLFMVLGAMISLVSAFWRSDNIALVVVLEILKTAFLIGAYYHMCGAFSALTRSWDEGLADKWSYIFVIYAIIYALAFFVTLVIRSTDKSDYGWIILFILSFIEAIAVLVQSVYELLLIKKTVELFERGGGSKTDAVRG